LETGGFIDKLRKLKGDMKGIKDDMLPSLYSAIKRKDGAFVQKIIDNLMFQLFDLSEKEIDYLIKKYYHL
jgi:hypothetical protein